MQQEGQRDLSSQLHCLLVGSSVFAVTKNSHSSNHLAQWTPYYTSVTNIFQGCCFLPAVRKAPFKFGLSMGKTAVEATIQLSAH